jgi:hypothetical protein
MSAMVHTANGNGGAAGGGPPTPHIILDDYFRHAVPPHDKAERADLERQLLADGVCLEPLVIWQQERKLVDGYSRYEDCTKHGIPYQTVPMAFENREEARNWVLAHHKGRRNLTANGQSYVRGARYLLEKQPHGAPLSKNGTGTQFSTGTDNDEGHIQSDNSVVGGRPNQKSKIQNQMRTVESQ